MKVRVGVIGLGIGERHLQEYSRLEGVRLSAAAEPRREPAERAQSLYGLRAYADGLEMIERDPLDAVSI